MLEGFAGDDRELLVDGEVVVLRHRQVLLGQRQQGVKHGPGGFRQAGFEVALQDFAAGAFLRLAGGGAHGRVGEEALELGQRGGRVLTPGGVAEFGEHVGAPAPVGQEISEARGELGGLRVWRQHHAPAADIGGGDAFGEAGLAANPLGHLPQRLAEGGGFVLETLQQGAAIGQGGFAQRVVDHLLQAEHGVHGGDVHAHVDVPHLHGAVEQPGEVAGDGGGGGAGEIEAGGFLRDGEHAGFEGVVPVLQVGGAEFHGQALHFGEACLGGGFVALEGHGVHVDVAVVHADGQARDRHGQAGDGSAGAASEGGLEEGGVQRRDRGGEVHCVAEPERVRVRGVLPLRRKAARCCRHDDASRIRL